MIGLVLAVFAQSVASAVVPIGYHTPVREEVPYYPHYGQDLGQGYYGKGLGYGQDYFGQAYYGKGLGYGRSYYGNGLGYGQGYYGKGLGYGQDYYGKGLGYGQDYYGNGRRYQGGYRNLAGKEELRGSGALAGRGLEGYDSHSGYVRGQEGGQGYDRKALGGSFGQGGGSFNSGENYRGSSSEDGYDGSGSAGHKKAHRTKGFHKSYHNVEEGKDTEFLDEDHDHIENTFDSRFGDSHFDKEVGAQSGGGKGNRYEENELLTVRGQEGEAGRETTGAARGGVTHNGYYDSRDLAHQQAHALHDNDFNQRSSNSYYHPTTYY